VLGLVLREIAILTGLGIALAAPLSFPLAKLANSMLFGVAPENIRTLSAAAAVLALTALASGAVPALRATRVDPLAALRRY
jgi:ABC-type antimicrobial peptide transport system permease subunit